MSYDPRQAARPYGTSQGGEGDTRRGSVREARERLQAAQKQRQGSDRSRVVGLPQRPNQLVSQFSRQKQQSQPEQNQPQRTEQRKNLNTPNSRDNGNATSSTPQWPLPSSADEASDTRPVNHSASPNRGPPPRRPPRPVSNDVPIQAREDHYESDDVFSPTSTTHSSRPVTTSSVASGNSSLGSIPDFPVALPPMPAVQPLPRRQPSLGPPPSARRGPASYYSQISYVSPIAEESETRSNTIHSHHGSFASSNVIPSNNDDFYDDEVRSEDDETVESDDGQGSTESGHHDRRELVQPALVRQASLGRRTKPSLMTIKSVDSFREKTPPSVKRKAVADGDEASGSAAGIGGAVLAARDGLGGQKVTRPPAAVLGNGTSLLSSSEESLASSKKSKPTVEYLDPEKDDLRAYLDYEKDDFVAYRDPEKDEYVSPVHPLQQGTRQTTLGERVGRRRPPRIDVDAVREAEARGSLTSLPELIRRATRLAANLDRGRTASRLGLDFWETGAPEKGTRRSGSLTDMLAAFPPPGEATPTGDRTPNPKGYSKWPSSRGKEYTGADSVPSTRSSTRRRRCCGMPMWTFVTLFIVLLFLVAAAVVIPIVLIVIPKMRDNQSNAAQTTGANNNNPSNSNNPTSNPLPPIPAPTSTSSNNQCKDILTCQNGGVAIFNGDRSCNCVCINGFTGQVCENSGDAACTTTNISGAASNATLGSGIPRLLESAESNFSIPLDGPGLLSLFSVLGLSCTTENALVTFDGLSSRSLKPSHSVPISQPLLDFSHRGQTTRNQRRQAIGEPGQAQPSPTPTPTSPSNSNSRPTSSPSGISTAPVSSNPRAIDFARIAVLLLLQETRSLDDAANAQVKIQDFLSNDRRGNRNGGQNGGGGRNGNVIDLEVFELNLGSLEVRFANGTVVPRRAFGV